MDNFWHRIPRPIVGLSPMDGVTDLAFRHITAKHGGPDVTFTEFVNVHTALYAPHTLIRDLTYDELERPVVAQVYGQDPELYYKIAHIVCELGFDGLDINMGCPARKVVGNGCGAALILTPELARSIIRSVRRGIEDWCRGQSLSALGLHPEVNERVRRANRLRTGHETPGRRRPIPVSVKTRLGYDRIIVENWVRALLAERPSVITLHGRTLKQMYKGEADWEAIGRAVAVAEGSGTLIFGNGDLRDMGDVYRRVRATRVDGVLVGRSAQGNPWFFRGKARLKEALLHGDRSRIGQDLEEPVSLENRIRVILEHSFYYDRFSGAPSFVGMRKHLAWYCKGFPGASKLRGQMVHAKDTGDVVRCLRDFTEMTAPARGGTGFTPWQPADGPVDPAPGL